MRQTKRIASLAALVLAAGAATAAQSAPGQQAPAALQSDAAKVVVVGCLQPADPAAGAAASASTAATVQFVLADARTTAVAGPGANAGGSAATAAGNAAPTGTSGTAAAQATGTSGAAGPKATYILLTENVEQLRPHANHQVEITGRLEAAGTGAKPSSAAAEPARSAAPADSGGGRPEDASARRLRVDAVQVINASCTQG